MATIRLDQVLARRLAVQRLTSPAAADVATVVRHLVCVQAQELGISRYSLGLRTGLDDAAIRAALDVGDVVRTHVLRPTWHYVMADDLRWLLDLTSDKVVSGLGARYRRLGLTAEVQAASEKVVTAVLDGGPAATRAELAERFAADGLPGDGDRVGALMLLAELRGLVCSGPLRGRTHTYRLLDDVAPATVPRDRDEAVRDLVHRFYAGHGPASDRDLGRWTTLTLTEIRAALADLTDAGLLTPVELPDARRLWGPPEVSRARPGAPRTLLLPTFDAAYLTSPDTRFPRVPGHPRGDEPVTYFEPGTGIVVQDRRDVGWWVRKETGRRIVVTLHLAESLSADDRAAVGHAAEHLAAFADRELVLTA